MNYDQILDLIEEMQEDLERKVEWPLTDRLPYVEVKRLVIDAHIALHNLHTYIQSAKKEATNG